jgi:hypothetical protein
MLLARRQKMKYRVLFTIILLLGIIVFLYLGCGKVVKPEGQDTTPPAVLSTTPANGATDIATNTSVTATFSESMDASSITSSFTLSSAAGAVAGTVSYTAPSKIATFSPAADLSSNTTYTATVSNQVKDLAGNNMSANYTWSFTTTSSADTTPPSVLSTTPTDGANDIAINTSVTATFSESMDASSITSSFTLSSAAGAVAGTVSYAESSKTATFSPAANLNSNTIYTAAVSNQVKDLAGNNMSANYTWSFTTSSSADTTRPAVLSTTPTNGAVEISTDTAVSATFSEEMDSSTINTSTFKITSAGGAVNGTVSYNTSSKTASFTPANLSYGTAYTASLSNGMKDLAGNRLETGDPEFDYSWSFTTQSNWTKITQVVPYLPSRRHHAVVTYNDKMWVIGGFDDGDNELNDVWSSSDGKTWAEETSEANFSPRTYHAATVYKDKMWIIGGQKKVVGYRGPTNDVWSSIDGKAWTLVASPAAFSARIDHKVIVHQNEMWLIGGSDILGDLKNDVWHSDDGITWTQATTSADFSARTFHEALTYNNKMWVIGGYDGDVENLNDVWSSEDGINWTQATASAAFSKRSDFLALNYKNKMWVMGGFGGLDDNDTWYSTDGETWSQMITPTNFVPRIYFDGTVFNNKMWVMGGAVGLPDPINDVMAFQ